MLREELKAAPDLARALARLALGRGGPRDLGAVRAAIGVAQALAASLARAGGALGLPRELSSIAGRLEASPGEVEQALAGALAESLPVNARDGGFIREGASADLDEQRKLRDGSRQVIAGLQATYAEATAIKSLKVRHNNVLGYFVEVTATNAASLTKPPHAETFVHRQTLANVMRFSTPELAELEARITQAADRALALELESLRPTLRSMCSPSSRRLPRRARRLPSSITMPDLPSLRSSRAMCARRSTRASSSPSRRAAIPWSSRICGAATAQASSAMTAGSATRTLARGRASWWSPGPTWPASRPSSARTRSSSCSLSLARSCRRASAHIGIVDRLFSRVGAADDLARGRSTFMVEMVETAAILNQASARSFVVLDEIGRGTATFDGLSIAWATLEYLHEVNRSRVLFATHYHELTALADKLPRAANATVEVKEWRDEIVFLYRVVQGTADRSYGIHVAKLAGLPPQVLTRANEVLSALEKADGRPKPSDLADDLPLFRAAKGAAEPKPDHASRIEQALAGLSPDAMTPKEALEALYRLKAVLASEA